MHKKLLVASLFIIFISLSSYGQCAGIANNACTTAAPTVIGNSISCTPPANQGGRRNFLVTNMVANATYRVSNCGSGFDTQLTIRNAAGVAVDFADDFGPDCFTTEASLDFVPPANGDYRMHLNRWNCATANALNGDIVVTLIADPPPPLTNDDCANAIALTTNASCVFSTYSTTGATDSGVADPGCASYQGGDVWFSAVVPASGNIEIDTDTGGFTDSGMALYTGTCGALTLVDCDDDDSANGAMSYIVATGLVPGSTVYIRVWEFGNNDDGDFDICVSDPPPIPTNDNCLNASTLNCGDTNIAGTTTNATAAGSAGCFYSDYGVWYTFTGDGSSVTITADPEVGYDIGMAIESGSCGALTNIACEDAGFGGDAESYSFNTSLGTDYYIYIAYWGFGNTTGDFTISMVCTPPINCQTNPTSTEDSCAVIAGGLGLNGADPAAVPCGTNPIAVDLEADFIDVGDTSDYLVEPISYNPPIAFSGLANPISLNTDDVWSSIISFPPQFDFCFYETNYTECIVGSNGILTFDTTNNTPGGFCDWQFDAELPGTADALIDNAIYGVFHDTDPSVGGEVGWELTTLPNGCRALVVAYHDVPMFSDNSQLYTGMMVLYEKTNIIEVYIEEKNVVASWNDGNAIVGIQNVGPTQAAFPCGRNGLDANWTATNEAWRFKPNGGTSITSLQWYANSVFPGNEIGAVNENPITVSPSATTTYYAEVTYNSTCNTTALTVTDDVTVTISQSKTWDGSTDSNWYDATNWTPPGVPNDTDCVLIPDVATTPNDAIADTNIGPPVPPATPALAGTLTIAAGGYLEVDEGTNLVVTDAINTTNGTGILNVRDSGSLIQVNDAAVNSGAIHVQRSPKTNQAAVLNSEYVYWSSPVQTTDVSTVSPGTAAGFIWEWEATVLGNGVGEHGDWMNSSGNMSLGKGYIVGGLSGTPTIIPTTAYPVTANTALFSGVPNNGIITQQIFHGSYDIVGDPGYQGNGPLGTLAFNNDDNWNLVGNPYPSAISANAFTNANPDINGTVYLWPHTSASDNMTVDPFYEDFVYNYNANDYVEHNNTGSNPPGTNDLYIASGQAFFVLMNHTSAPGSNITFDNSMRQVTANYDNDNFYDPFNPDDERDAENDTTERHRIWLDLITSDHIANTLLVGYIEGATNDFDRLNDGYEFAGSSISFYSINNDDKMSIQGRALPFEDTDIVPLGVVIPDTDLYKIALNTIDGLFESEEQSIYLEDTYTNTIHNLRESPYQFNSDAGKFEDRFILRYTDDTLGVSEFNNDSSITIQSVDGTIVVTSKNSPIQDIVIYDLLGRTIIDLKNLNTLEYTISSIQLSNSVYMVRASLQNDRRKTKKVVH